MNRFQTLLVVGGTLLLAAGCGGDDSSGSPIGYSGPGPGGSGGNGGGQGGSSGNGASGKAGMTSGGASGHGEAGGSSGKGGAGTGSGGLGGSGAMVCTPGQSVACIGPAGCQGGQSCKADGSGYEPCDCGSAGAGGAGGAGGSGSSGSAGKGGAVSGGGSAGQGGSGGSGGPVSTEGIGASCESNKDCASGLTCYTQIGANGIPGGLCTFDCSDYSMQAAAAGAPPSIPDPCDPTATGPDLPKAVCLRTSADGEPVKAVCFQACTFGAPELFGDQQHLLGSPAEPGKCSGREDFGCYPLDYTTDNQLFAYCKPACQSDQHCNEGQRCEIVSGTCVASLPAGLKKNGEACEAGVYCTADTDCTVAGQTCSIEPGQSVGVCADPTAPRECEGFCLHRYGSTAPVADQSKGFCVDPCLAGPGDQACGGIESGVCVYNIFASPVPGTDPPDYPSLGFQDMGGCQKIVAKDDDKSCLWQQGFFADYVSGLMGSLCQISRECENEAGCGYACQTDAQCSPGSTQSTCKNGMCTLSNGTLYTGGNSCVAVDALCGKKLCLDHTPTLPKPSSCP